MGIKLIVEVLDHAPRDLSQAELVVLIAIAEEANDVTREAWPGMTKLARRTRMAPVSVRHVLERLRDRKLEIRVPIGIDHSGAPVFAGRGRCTVYRIPAFSMTDRSPIKDTYLADSRTDQDTNRPVRGPDRDTNGPDRGPGQDTGRSDSRPGQDTNRPVRGPGQDALPLSKELLLQQQASKIVTSETDADEVEARAVVAAVVAEKRPANLVGFLTTLARARELPEWVERVRARAGRAGRDEWLAQLDAQPECDHGYRGGHVPDGDGWVRCPIERRRRTRGVA